MKKWLSALSDLGQKSCIFEKKKFPFLALSTEMDAFQEFPAFQKVNKL